MTGEISLYGVFLPFLLPVLLVALVLAACVRSILTRLRIYRFVWHRPLFDLAVFVILLGGVSSAARMLGAQ
jgi:hypothetical protein